VVAWYIDISEFGLKFKPRGPIKAQCVVDFMAELPPKPSSGDIGDWWMLYVDGAYNPKGSRAGITLERSRDISLKQSLFDFKTSYNQVEYEALIVGIKLEKEVEVKKIRCRNDSKLITSQVNGDFQAKDT